MKLGANVTDLAVINIKIFNCKADEMTEYERLRDGRLCFIFCCPCIL